MKLFRLRGSEVWMAGYIAARSYEDALGMFRSVYGEAPSKIMELACEGEFLIDTFEPPVLTRETLREAKRMCDEHVVPPPTYQEHLDALRAIETKFNAGIDPKDFEPEPAKPAPEKDPDAEGFSRMMNESLDDAKARLTPRMSDTVFDYCHPVEHKTLVTNVEYRLVYNEARRARREESRLKEANIELAVKLGEIGVELERLHGQCFLQERP